ncbi:MULTISPECIES: hypothetical protein [Mycolicibacterium]|uniref:hypothetical protein n=1 Tax=Mycolicibacterium TaxID=1866885 RepID=UPI001CDB7F7D|nr:hypothetical protein [Mycolicibacterium fortuitum]UBV20396.1 hypothetical protein H8Z59_24490 [Mycolicibacterium fortuitum]
MNAPMNGDRVIALGWDIDSVDKGDHGVVTAATGTAQRDLVDVEFTTKRGIVHASAVVAEVATCGCPGSWGTKQDRWAHADAHAAELKQVHR